MSTQLDRLVQELLSRRTERIRTVAIVSSVRGEGATACVINVAAHLTTYHEFRVLLVDANLRDPSLHNAFHLEMDNGLSDVLLGNAELAAVIKKTQVPNLSVVTGGSFVSKPNQLLDAERLASSLFGMTTNYDYVLLDCPPVNYYPDTARIAPLCDGVILVVHAGKTRRKVVQRAETTLDHVNANVLGVILNKRKYYIPKFIYDRL